MSNINPFKIFLACVIAFGLNACTTVGDHRIASEVVTISAVPTNDHIVSIENLPDVSANHQSAVVVSDPPVSTSTVAFSDEEIACMAHVIYFEARGEGARGMTGVGYVVLNRMSHREFPKTVCAVVYQKNRRGCQFSWVCDGKPDRIRQPQSYERARSIAVQVLNRSVENPVGNSLYFRHRSVKSRYAHTQKLYASIGHHNFFAALR